MWSGFDADRYVGPWDADTANPVLVVGTRFDPATRYEGREIVRDLLPNSSLLTVEGWGHTSLFLSACADAAVSDYLLTRVPPADGTVCAQDFGPFGRRRPGDHLDRPRRPHRRRRGEGAGSWTRSPWCHGADMTEPDWVDHNPSDPGITLLGLVAFLVVAVGVIVMVRGSRRDSTTAAIRPAARDAATPVLGPGL